MKRHLVEVRLSNPSIGGIMLVRFSSTKTEPLTMFGDIAVQLIRMMGASGSVPGAIAAEDMPAAESRVAVALHAAADASAKTRTRTMMKSMKRPLIGTRAAPLLDLLERASAGNAALMWEAQ
jgi:hypothetical protein